ncbi:OmpA family protein [Burkholderia guangdongensis]|uniref:OmpA family protein n=1 Tax=Burkholderia guangdongensis TaxID=1792500 RepID=UPI001FE8A8C9|nr:OmpA family protein [Burkholderia guangdongensis]
MDGYTDARGPVNYNLDLSDRRAGAVATYLRAHGLQSRAWNIRGHGTADPISTNIFRKIYEKIFRVEGGSC